ncbi:hypothetical protein [Flavobacterium silvaticum]|uniref:Uncharacterized protein n=1 Tax=Flavobacterium silvaticum TaxID=1852020 RepID=A0A972FMN3_9FLAO|nr:hypothetical protein [Flavobacterium silvaticum]NMH28487.1 hypothetical protein [Flavobacterium silvaticum]
MSKLKKNNGTGIDNDDEQLRAILVLFKSRLESYSQDASQSYELLKLGAKDKLAQDLEKTIKDPLGSLSDVTDEIDEKIKSIIDTLVRSFLTFKNDFILNAYKSNTSINNLYYSIVLKEDNIENRNAIFEFFEVYDLIDISTKYPVYFQFTPLSLVDNIKSKEELLFG